VYAVISRVALGLALLMPTVAPAFAADRHDDQRRIWPPGQSQDDPRGRPDQRGPQNQHGPQEQRGRPDQRSQHDQRGPQDHRGPNTANSWRGDDRHGGPSRYSWHGGRYDGPSRPRVVVVQPHRAPQHHHAGYGNYHSDRDAFRWLGFAALTFALIDRMSENQQRAFEIAQIQASTARIGQPVYWGNAGATGTVVATREGRAADGAYCREFQQSVVVGGRSEQAYGVACQQPDGTWQIVPSDY
jgi:hypothetical protein